MGIFQSDRFIGKLLRLPKAFIPRHKTVRILRGPLRGKRWLTATGPEGWWLGLSEQEKLKFVAGLVSDGKVFYDLGANIGLYTLLAST